MTVWPSFVKHFDQSIFRVVAKALYAMATAALFDHPPQAVVAVTFILIGDHLVMNDEPGAGIWSIQQVCRSVVRESFLLAIRTVLTGNNASGGIVMEQLTVLAGEMFDPTCRQGYLPGRIRNVSVSRRVGL